MKTRFRSAILALIATAGLITGVTVVAPAAQAVTWTNLGTMQDTTYFDSCDGDTGNVQMKVQWEVSSDNKLRLDADYDIKIYNNSNGRIGVDSWGGSGDFGHLTYERNVSPYLISAYTYTGGATVYIPAHSSKTFSANSADRWVRIDGVADSNASPSDTYISTNSDPRIHLTTSMQIYHPASGQWYGCGSSTGIQVEVLNNAA